MAMKFWIGGAGGVANMAIVWAQLYVKGVNHGLHAFIAPIRDKETHTPYVGVVIITNF